MNTITPIRRWNILSYLRQTFMHPCLSKLDVYYTLAFIKYEFKIQEKCTDTPPCFINQGGDRKREVFLSLSWSLVNNSQWKMCADRTEPGSPRIELRTGPSASDSENRTGLAAGHIIVLVVRVVNHIVLLPVFYAVHDHALVPGNTFALGCVVALWRIAEAFRCSHWALGWLSIELLALVGICFHLHPSPRRSALYPLSAF